MPLDEARVLEAMQRDLRAHVGTLQMDLLMAKAVIAEWERLHDALLRENTRLVADRDVYQAVHQGR